MLLNFVFTPLFDFPLNLENRMLGQYCRTQYLQNDAGQDSKVYHLRVNYFYWSLYSEIIVFVH